jgi:hypothetical protein
VKFVLDAILNILRGKLEKVPSTKGLALSSNDIVMVELCAIHKLISYPDFSQITQVINNLDRVTEPKLSTTAAMVSCQSDAQLMSKYIPQYKNGQEYNFSDARGFHMGQSQVGRTINEAEAKQALRTLVDFMKTEIAERDQGMVYEPLFS